MRTRLPAWVKLLATFALLVAEAIDRAPTPARLASLGAVLIAAAVLGRVRLTLILRRLVLLEPVVLGVALLALLGPGGWRTFLVLVAKSTGCLLALLLLSDTTPFSEILRVLKGLRVPALLVTTIALMYRYLFVLADESQRMRRARASRTFTPSRAFQWRTLSTLVAQLFIRAHDRAERIYSAMCARGWA